MKGTVILTTDASGAAEAASRGRVVLIVDVIDFSTTMEAALESGALEIFGAAPDAARPPVFVDPFKIGILAGRAAVKNSTDVVLVAEPRTGSDGNRMESASRALAGVAKAGASVGAVLPNLGAETPRLADLSNRVVLGVSGTGGVAFDAAVNAGAPLVLTGTVARTLQKRGAAPAREAAGRAARAAEKLNTAVAVVAASGNSLEDILAAEFIYKLIVDLLRKQ
jgi:hypothetical protein